MNSKKLRMLLIASIIVAATPTHQAAAQSNAGPERFDSENAVLDTSKPFAIGATEAEQAIRGAFGWPVFQEGIVAGAYFRFDPDGYARFGPSPRLDRDVWEVTCVARTVICAANKMGVEVALTDQGMMQMAISGLTVQDTFFLSDGTSELPLPPRVLEPLDDRLEALLISGGNLVVRRENETIHDISLNGLGAVVPYLRWVANKQDYSVLPVNWPIPNSGNQISKGLTQVADWNGNGAPPQNLQTSWAMRNQQNTAPSGGFDQQHQRGNQPVNVTIVPGLMGATQSMQQAGLGSTGSAGGNELNSEISRLEGQIAQLQQAFNKDAEVAGTNSVGQLQSSSNQMTPTPQATPSDAMGSDSLRPYLEEILVRLAWIQSVLQPIAHDHAQVSAAQSAAPHHSTSSSGVLQMASPGQLETMPSIALNQIAGLTAAPSPLEHSQNNALVPAMPSLQQSPVQASAGISPELEMEKALIERILLELDEGQSGNAPQAAELAPVVTPQIAGQAPQGEFKAITDFLNEAMSSGG